MECKGVNGQSPKPKVVFVLGATATGKSKLAISLARRFGGEVINSDKIQVYDGVPILTNKVTEEESAGVPHHLLGGVHPDADFTADDFRRVAEAAISRVISAGRLPVVAGGSNNYVEALVEADGAAFRAAHDCLFLWLDAAPGLMEWYTGLRVDDMVRRGLVDETRAAFEEGADYTRGVRRAIGLPEMHEYLRAEREGAVGAAEMAALLERAVREIKANTFGLVLQQAAKIRRLSTLEGWDVRRVDATAVFASMAEGSGGHKEVWESAVWAPCQEMVRLFLHAEAATLPTDLEVDEAMAGLSLGVSVIPVAAVGDVGDDDVSVVLTPPTVLHEHENEGSINKDGAAGVVLNGTHDVVDKDPACGGGDGEDHGSNAGVAQAAPAAAGAKPDDTA
ncbi:adenylate isopentenyltransferase 5, chloroplastic-like [Hordeum vulgare subsp. vulgare]|uniref:adenylate dimethylallyltransferase (ADP/ATP-dependent) n=1 Tax=Hordeum vulgare subsp. vulgare TaxID=112509 RepID=A0A8I6WQG4_HORVV|nr:adenylate isopentenyltransferase 5, chloroplastic-like [Hordeum vulgare subsp. vulgare]